MTKPETSHPESASGNSHDGHSRRRLGSKLLGWLKPSVPERPSPQLLPPSVLYALSYRKAQLNGKDVETLQRSGLPRAAFYLALKSAEDGDRVQAGLLQRLADVNFDYARLAIDDIRPATERMEGLKTHVGGEKLGQFSRHGFDHSVERFDTTLGQTFAGRIRAPLFMVANYPFIALDVLAEHSLQAGHGLGIIKPERLGQTQSPVGFMMEPTPNGVSVRALEHDFARPPGAVIFDDVLRTGHVRDQVLGWWGDETPHDFVTGVTVTSTL